MFIRVYLPVFSLVLATCNAFTNQPIRPISTAASRVTKKTSSSQLHLSPEFGVENARRLFYLWFFGASGGGGIAVGAFPQMAKKFQDIQALKGVGPTLGGENIGLPPLLTGYPEDLKLADVQKILNNKMTVEQMVNKGPKDSFWAERGYLRFESFVAANKNCNPLALRAVFDAMTTSVSTVSPVTAQQLLDAFRDDIGLFKRTLLLSKAKGYSAIAFLLFLLGIAAATSADAFASGWFPDWPGLENFPVSLINPGFWTIPEYWI